MRKFFLFAMTSLLLTGFAVAQEPEAPQYSAFVGVGLEPDARPAGGAGLLAHINGKLYSYSGLSMRGVGDGSNQVFSVLQGGLFKVQDTEQVDVFIGANGGIQQDAEATRPDFNTGGVASFQAAKWAQVWGGALFGDSQTEGGLGWRYVAGVCLGSC